jgi:hypothetical protein
MRRNCFLPFPSFECDCQCCSFPIQRNRDKISARKFDVGLFTQARSTTDLPPSKSHFRSTPETGHRRPGRPCRFGAKSGHALGSD